MPQVIAGLEILEDDYVLTIQKHQGRVNWGAVLFFVVMLVFSAHLLFRFLGAPIPEGVNGAGFILLPLLFIILSLWGVIYLVRQGSDRWVFDKRNGNFKKNDRIIARLDQISRIEVDVLESDQNSYYVNFIVCGGKDLRCEFVESNGFMSSNSERERSREDIEVIARIIATFIDTVYCVLYQPMRLRK